MMKHAITESLTIYNAAALYDALVALLSEHDNLTLDLAAVAEVDSSGVQLLVHLKKKALAHKKSLVLTNHPLIVIEAFDLYNLHNFFGDDVVILSEEDSML